MSLALQQKTAFDEIKKWYTNPKKKPYFKLGGYAGAGKTYLIKYILEDLFKGNVGDFLVATLTWKASLLLMQKGIESASIHSSFYYNTDDDPKKVKTSKLEFRPMTKDEFYNKHYRKRLIIIDEASMVDEKMRNVILSFGIPVLFVGDPCQLPAISTDGEKATNVNFMEDSDIILTEIHRQALDSPIIRMSMDIREGRGIPYGKYGPKVVKIRKADLSEKTLLAADMIICGKNATRKELNNEIRTLKGLNVAETPRDGERLVVLENNVPNFIFNGMLLEIKEPVNYTGPARSILISPKDTFYYTKDIQRINDPDPVILHESGLCFIDEYDTIPKVNKLFDRIGIENSSKDPYGNYFEATQEPYKVKRTISSICKLKNIPVVDFGYALTLHKCQGSSYDKVLVYFEYMKGMDSDMKKKWMYTAVTRAERALCIVE